ncbi:MAG: hypothetical protein Q9213_004751, partial [Squamulea squamosa]
MPWRAIEVTVERIPKPPETHQVRQEHSDASSIQVSRALDDLAAERRRIMDRLAERNYRRKVIRSAPGAKISDPNSSDEIIVERTRRRSKSPSPSLDSEIQRKFQKLQNLEALEHEDEQRVRGKYRTILLAGSGKRVGSRKGPLRPDQIDQAKEIRERSRDRNRDTESFIRRIEESSLVFDTPEGEEMVEDYEPEEVAEEELDDPSSAASQKIIDDLLK